MSSFEKTTENTTTINISQSPLLSLILTSTTDKTSFENSSIHTNRPLVLLYNSTPFDSDTSHISFTSNSYGKNIEDVITISQVNASLQITSQETTTSLNVSTVCSIICLTSIS